MWGIGSIIFLGAVAVTLIIIELFNSERNQTCFIRVTGESLVIKNCEVSENLVKLLFNFKFKSEN